MGNIEISKVAGIDQPPGRFQKNDTEILPKAITETCNLSISYGIFSIACKVAKRKPIFKKDNKIDLYNYRPMSLLPVTPKVVKVQDQTNEFLSEKKYYMTVSLDSDLVTRLIRAYLS